MKKQQEPNGKRQYISRLTFYILSALLLIYTFSSADAQKISVGSKRFTESYVSWVSNRKEIARRCGIPCGTQAGDGRHDYRVGGATEW